MLMCLLVWQNQMAAKAAANVAPGCVIIGRRNTATKINVQLDNGSIQVDQGGSAEAVPGEAAGSRQEGRQGEGIEAPAPPQPSSAEEAT